MGPSLTCRVIAAGDEASPEAFEALLQADLWENYFHYVESVARNNRPFLEAVGFDEGAERAGPLANCRTTRPSSPP